MPTAPAHKQSSGLSGLVHRPTLFFEVEVKEGHSNVQLPPGLGYSAGDKVHLTEKQYAELSDAAFGEGGPLIDNGPVSPFTIRGTQYWVVDEDPEGEPQ